MLRATLVLLGAVGLGCGAAETFACDSADDCGAGGLCEPAGYCSFADGSCPSGRRYGDHAPAGIAGTCAPPSDETGGSSGASDTATSSVDTTTMQGSGGTSTESGTQADTSESSASTGVGSTGGTSETTSVAETSTGPDGCDALACDACLECVVAPDGPCVDENGECERIRECSTAVQCIEDCVASGLCLDPCCDGVVYDEVDTLILCVADACPTACASGEFFTCDE